jgi:hypothetical protein
MLEQCLDAGVSLTFGTQEREDLLLALRQDLPARRHRSLAELRAG